MLTFIGNFKEFCSEPQGLPSIKEFFSTKPYKDKDKVIRYLRNGGIEDMFSMAIQKDCITGEIIPGIDIGRNDGEYTWWTSLAYYVERYNLRLPTEFEKKALDFYKGLKMEWDKTRPDDWRSLPAGRNSHLPYR